MQKIDKYKKENSSNKYCPLMRAKKTSNYCAEVAGLGEIERALYA